MKFPHRNLNLDPYPLHLTSIYTYRVTIAPRIRSGKPSQLIYEKQKYNFRKASIIQLTLL